MRKRETNPDPPSPTDQGAGKVSRGLRRGKSSSPKLLMCAPEQWYLRDVLTLHDLEDAVRDLSPRDFAAFRAWFAEYDAVLWDRQLEEDVLSGHLDAMMDEALRESREGCCTDLMTRVDKSPDEET